MKQDRRVQKTEHLYQEALLTLLKHKSMNQISIKELSECAHLHRGTFYLHYKGVKELLFSIEKEIIQKLEEICLHNQRDSFHALPYSVLLEIFQFLDGHREVMTIFLHKDTYLVSEMKRILMVYCIRNCEYLYKETIKEEYEFLCGYTVEGMMFVFKEWITSERKNTPEEMAIRLQRIILHGVQSLHM